MGGHCVVCGAVELERLAGYERLPRVTSDTKPWPAGGELAVCARCGAIQKPVTAAWRQEIESIYAAYDSFFLTEDADQLIFIDGVPWPRTGLLADFLIGATDLPPRGRLIDVGAGKGAALANFAARLPGWSFHASELSDRALPALRRIPGFTRLHVGELGDLAERFTVISLIHTLEHIVEPVSALAALRDKLEPAGLILVEVPDIEASPFDLLVADHRSHFSLRTLSALAGRAGLAVRTIDNRVIAKEITLVARAGERKIELADPAAGRRVVGSALAWLAAITDQLRALMARGPVGLFGTAVAAMALYGIAPARVEFFVDEDAGRQGKRFDGKPVLAPADAPRDVPLYVPLAPATAARVAARLRADHGLPAIEPPPYPAA